MWQLLALAVLGALKAIGCLSDSGRSSSSHSRPPSPDHERTQGVSGYTRWDGAPVRNYRRRPPR